MKIFAWNCQGAFRKKADVILPYWPDIAIISECEHPDKLHFSDGFAPPTDALWFGNNLHKGLGVFSFGVHRFELMEIHHPDFKNILPIAVTGGKIDFTLFAVWANHPLDPNGAYVTQVWKAIHHYEPLLSAGPAILAGDFNSNTLWDKPRRKGNHTDVVVRLEQRGITSTYHRFHAQMHGQELHPTFFLHRDKNKPYHLDYCFASEHFTGALENVEIGSYENWITHSDHTPVITTFAC